MGVKLSLIAGKEDKLRVFKNKREEIAVSWRKLHNEELYDLYCSANIMWVIGSRTVRWMWHVWWRKEMCTWLQ